MKPKKRSGTVGSSALILLAPEFKEGRTVYCLERLREAGISVSMIGLSAGLISGYHGMTVRPDFTLSQMPDCVSHKVVLIPDGKACVSALFADPRIHRLIKATLAGHGIVAAMPEAESMLERAGLVTSESAPSFVWSRDKDLKTFAGELINHLE